MTLRVIFDSNVFDEEFFPQMQAVTREQCRRGKLTILYPSIVVEEALRVYGSQTKRNLLVDSWLPFMLSTTKRFLAEPGDIFFEEVVRNRGAATPRTLRQSADAALRRTLLNLPRDGSWPGFSEAKPERDKDLAKDVAQRKIALSMRKQVHKRAKELGIQGGDAAKPPFSEIRDLIVDGMGRDFLPAVLKVPVTPWVIERWATNKAQYPFYTGFISDVIYMGYYAMRYPSAKVDQNALNDLKIQRHLMDADAIVSNEKTFFQTAFDDLWKAQGKQLYTSLEFKSFLATF